MTWQYKIVDLGRVQGYDANTQNEAIYYEEGVLSELGKDGWELIDVVIVAPGERRAYFKRLVP